MEMTGTQRIEASRETVYAALNDVEVLQQCIPGCEKIEKVSDVEMKATVKLKIGPMKVSFDGAVTLTDLDPPSSYTIVGEGTGGIAGFAKGRAAVRLEADGAATVLQYDVRAEVGGKIAQLGARLIDSTAKKLAAEFFARLGSIVKGPGAATEPMAQAPEDKAEATKKKGWFGKAFGPASAIAVAGALFLPSCCIGGYEHALDDLAPLCHAQRIVPGT